MWFSRGGRIRGGTRNRQRKTPPFGLRFRRAVAAVRNCAQTAAARLYFVVFCAPCPRASHNPPSPHPRPLPRTRRLTHHRQHLQTSSILGTKVRITHIYHSHPSSHPRPLPLLLPHDCLVPPNVEETRCAARKKQEEEKSVPLQDFVLKRLLVADCLQQCFLHNIKFDLYSLETCFPVLLGNFLKETLMQI